MDLSKEEVSSITSLHKGKEPTQDIAWNVGVRESVVWQWTKPFCEGRKATTLQHHKGCPARSGKPLLGKMANGWPTCHLTKCRERFPRHYQDRLGAVMFLLLCITKLSIAAVLLLTQNIQALSWVDFSPLYRLITDETSSFLKSLLLLIFGMNLCLAGFPHYSPF